MKEEHRYIFCIRLCRRRITRVHAKALINAAFLGSLPHCTMYLIARVFLIALFTHRDVLKPLHPVNISIGDDISALLSVEYHDNFPLFNTVGNIYFEFFSRLDISKKSCLQG